MPPLFAGLWIVALIRRPRMLSYTFTLIIEGADAFKQMRLNRPSFQTS